jgi:hypothetical protein
MWIVARQAQLRSPGNNKGDPKVALLTPCHGRENFGGCTRARTLDPLIKSQLLYHLSYAPGLVLTTPSSKLTPSSKAIWPCPASEEENYRTSFAGEQIFSQAGAEAETTKAAQRPPC